MSRFFVMIVITVILVSPSHGSDEQRELQFSELAKPNLLSGDVVTLRQNGQAYWAILTKTVAAEAYGTAIILHDRGEFPDREAVVHDLRTTLPKHRWSTFALQMPLREKGASEREYYALFPEAKKRIGAAIGYLRQSGENRIVMIGYGLGALMAAYSLSEDRKNIAALVTISLAVPESDDEQAQTLAFLQKLRLPLLDIYAEYDLPTVVNSAGKRKLAAVGNPDYRHVKIPVARHSFRHNDILLSKRIYSWLNRTFMAR